jgi:cyclic pyranopterin phosphate synthase
VRLPIAETSVSSAPARAGLDNGPRSISAVRVLRLSVTDRCNFRCVYCMPSDGVRWLPREEILGFEEICDVVRAAIDIHGIRRFKLTGGEPTVRHGLVDLVAMLRRIPGIEDLSLTTNGQRMLELANPLREAGLDRVTISLDSLQPEKFRRITRTGDLKQVLAGLDRCEDVGFDSLKINCVTMRGTNDDELADFARMSLNRRLTVRFIEYMPLGDAAILHVPESIGRIADDEQGPAAGCGAQYRGDDALIPEGEVRQIIEDELGLLVPINREMEAGVGPANVYRLALGKPAGRIGFISAMSAPFCATCNRLRLTANGVLRSCLFEGGEVDVHNVLRSTDDPVLRRQAVAQAMVDCVRLKPDVHGGHGNQQMSRMGG